MVDFRLLLTLAHLQLKCQMTAHRSSLLGFLSFLVQTRHIILHLQAGLKARYRFREVLALIALKAPVHMPAVLVATPTRLLPQRTTLQVHTTQGTMQASSENYVVQPSASYASVSSSYAIQAPPSQYVVADQAKGNTPQHWSPMPYTGLTPDLSLLQRPPHYGTPAGDVQEARSESPEQRERSQTHQGRG